MCQWIKPFHVAFSLLYTLHLYIRISRWRSYSEIRVEIERIGSICRAIADPILNRPGILLSHLLTCAIIVDLSIVLQTRKDDSRLLLTCDIVVDLSIVLQTRIDDSRLSTVLTLSSIWLFIKHVSRWCIQKLRLINLLLLIGAKSLLQVECGKLNLKRICLIWLYIVLVLILDLHDLIIELFSWPLDLGLSRLLYGSSHWSTDVKASLSILAVVFSLILVTTSLDPIVIFIVLKIDLRTTIDFEIAMP